MTLTKFSRDRMMLSASRWSGIANSAATWCCLATTKNTPTTANFRPPNTNSIRCQPVCKPTAKTVGWAAAKTVPTCKSRVA